MTRDDVFLAVLGGFNLCAGFDLITDAIHDDSAWKAISGCCVLAIGIWTTAIAYRERRKAEKAATLTTGR